MEVPILLIIATVFIIFFGCYSYLQGKKDTEEEFKRKNKINEGDSVSSEVVSNDILNNNKKVLWSGKHQLS